VLFLGLTTSIAVTENFHISWILGCICGVRPGAISYSNGRPENFLKCTNVRLRDELALDSADRARFRGEDNDPLRSEVITEVDLEGLGAELRQRPWRPRTIRRSSAWSSLRGLASQRLTRSKASLYNYSMNQLSFLSYALLLSSISILGFSMQVKLPHHQL